MGSLVKLHLHVIVERIYILIIIIGISALHIICSSDCTCDLIIWTQYLIRDQVREAAVAARVDSVNATKKSIVTRHV